LHLFLQRKQQLEQQLTAIQGRMADLEDKQRQTAASMQPLHDQFEGLQQQIKALQDDTNKHAAQ
jgi:phage shock protein A